MKKLLMRVSLFLMIMAGVVGSGLPVSAAIETTFLKHYYKYSCDLNGDGKKETIECIYGQDGKDLLYINEEKVLSATSKNSNGYFLMDVNEKDRYLEIYGRSKYPGKSVFYRYNGKKMVAIAAGLYGDGKIFKSVPAEAQYWDSQPGNGTYIAYMALIVDNLDYKYIPMMAKFGRSGKKMIFLANEEHELATETMRDGVINYSITPRAKTRLPAYKKPSLKGNDEAFTLEKGDKYTFLKVKFSSPYTFVQIMDLKTEKTGWLIMKTSQFKLAAGEEQISKPEEDNTPPQKKEQTITVNKTIVKTYRKGETFNLGARAAGKLTYKSSNTKVAVISASGIVTITGYGTAVITVNAAETAEYKAATTTVQLTVTQGDEEQLVSVTSRNGYLMIEWERNSQMSGYEINVAPDKSFSSYKRGIASSSLTKTSVSGLTVGRTYFVRIRGYRLVSGNRVYGPWSAVKYCKISSITLPEVQLISVTSPKKGYMRIKWRKNSQVTGYQLQCSTQKEFGNPNWINIKNKNLVEIDTPIDSGRGYYVRIQGYVSVNGTNVYGPWSAVKYCVVR